MRQDQEALIERRNEARELFRERKARFSYYVISLPFAVLAVAVASYPYSTATSSLFVALELVAWLLLLGGGAAGLRGKWGEMEYLRKSSILASVAIHEAQANRAPDAGSAEVNRKHERERVAGEQAEEFGIRWLYRLLAAGLAIWILSRSILAVSILFVQ